VISIGKMRRKAFERDDSIACPAQHGDVNRLAVRSLWALWDVWLSKPDQTAFGALKEATPLSVFSQMLREE
jgi:hypothetical protein